MAAIDLNADLGELGDGSKLDEAMMASITSANIACGFHAGEATTIRRTCQLAVEHDVVIGAHVSYRDWEGFGRRFIEIAPKALIDDVLYQLGALSALAAAVGGQVRYVKPHGALYHAVTDRQDHAAAVVEAIVTFDRSLTVLAFPGSVVLSLAAKAGLATATEAFADRRYRDGRLVPRTETDAVITDPVEVCATAVDAATSGMADSLCLHGDTPGAAKLATRVRAALDAAGVHVRPFIDHG